VPLVMHHPTKARYFYDLAVRLVPVEHRNEIHSVSQILTMVALVAAGRGVAFVPESARLLGGGGVSYLRLAGASTDVVELHAIWARGARSPVLGRLLQVLRLKAR
ncbi:LysR family transcriptional regulator, partial [Arthrobacter deserti]|nr:LysR family transcriptional regulator [Arthrobacter deserti]